VRCSAFDIAVLLPGQDGVRGELSAVVADDHARASPGLDDAIELAHDPWGGERGIDHQAKALPGAVIDQGEDAEAPAADQRVHDKVERPAQVPVLRDRHRCSGAESPFTAATLAHGQPLFLVEPVELLRAEPDALALQHQAETPIAEPPAL
jgi:hypothetical protein